MENENITTDEIGKIARIIDTQLTINQRMKIKKTTIKKITIALTFYLVTMIIFSLTL